MTQPWGYATLVDYLLSACFVAVYVVSRRKQRGSIWSGLLLGAAVILLGHAMTMLYMIVVILRAGSLDEAFLPLLTIPRGGSEKRRNPWTWIIATVAVGLLLYYTYVCAVALRVETLAVAWEKTKANPWVMLTFVDNLLGVLFVALYIMVSERRSSSFFIWLTFLLLTGNGTSVSTSHSIFIIPPDIFCTTALPGTNLTRNAYPLPSSTDRLPHRKNAQQYRSKPFRSDAGVQRPCVRTKSSVWKKMFSKPRTATCRWSQTLLPHTHCGPAIRSLRRLYALYHDVGSVSSPYEHEINTKNRKTPGEKKLSTGKST